MRIIGGTFRGRTLHTPAGKNTRPTQGRLREAVFNILQHEIADARFLDICAGSGAMGLEALSRGAAFVAFIDSSRDAIQCIRKNVEALQVQDNTKILCGDARKILPQLDAQAQSFDICYIDAPYAEHAVITDILTVLDNTTCLCGKNALIFLETDGAIQLPELHHCILQDTRTYGDSALLLFMVV